MSKDTPMRGSEIPREYNQKMIKTSKISPVNTVYVIKDMNMGAEQLTIAIP